MGKKRTDRNIGRRRKCGEDEQKWMESAGWDLGWRPIIGADCRPVAIMELTSENAALLLIASENVHLKLKTERSGFMKLIS